MSRSRESSIEKSTFYVSFHSSHKITTQSFSVSAFVTAPELDSEAGLDREAGFLPPGRFLDIGLLGLLDDFGFCGVTDG